MHRSSRNLVAVATFAVVGCGRAVTKELLTGAAAM